MGKPTSPGLGKKYRAFNAPNKVERKPARFLLRNGEASGTQQSPGYNQVDALTANKAKVDVGDKHYFKTMQNASVLAQKYQNTADQRANVHLKR